MTLKSLKTIYYITMIIMIIMIININANNDHFADLGNRYFSACDCRRFIRCQSVADVKENPGGGGVGGGGLREGGASGGRWSSHS